MAKPYEVGENHRLGKQEWNGQNPNTIIGINNYQIIDKIKEKSDRNGRK